MAFAPPIDLSSEVVIGKLLGLFLFTFYFQVTCLSLFFISSKLHQKCPRAKGILDDAGVIIPPPAPSGMDNLIT